MMFEVVRHFTATGFQRCGHKHHSKKSASKCRDKLNKYTRIKWRVSPVGGKG